MRAAAKPGVLSDKPTGIRAIHHGSTAAICLTLPNMCGRRVESEFVISATLAAPAMSQHGACGNDPGGGEG